MMKLKICGITRVEDALQAAELGAWAVGFIFFPKSPRYIKPEAAQAVIEKLPKDLEKVGVFVNPRPEELKAVLRLAPLTLAQFHGDESPEACESSGLPFVKVFRADASLGLYARARGFMLDAPAGENWGGVGKKADWASARRLRERRDREAPGKLFFLAGGLNADNLGEAARVVAPDVLDVSSGVEDSPGIKSATKLKKLFEALKAGAN